MSQDLFSRLSSNIAVGNMVVVFEDFNDLRIMLEVGLTFVPNDSPSEIKTLLNSNQLI